MKTLLLIFCLVGLSACGGGYNNAWHDVYGNECGSLRPGCNFYSDGKKIEFYQDPHSGSWNYPDWGYDEIPSGWKEVWGGWESPNGIVYDSWGNALNAQRKSEASAGRNVVGDVAAETQKTIKAAGKRFAEKYQVTLDVGNNIAHLFNNWALIGKDRARTEADIKSFTKRLYGIELGEIRVALESAHKGDMTGLEKGMSEVALSWGTTPEMVKEMQKSWFAPQLKEYGY